MYDLVIAATYVRVNAIGPGPIDNRMIRSLESQFSPADAAAGQAFILSNIPMQRYGTNEEVAISRCFWQATNQATAPAQFI